VFQERHQEEKFGGKTMTVLEFYPKFLDENTGVTVFINEGKIAAISIADTD